MDPVDKELPIKKSKTDDSRCCHCKIFFRKGLVKKAKEIKTKEEAENFFRTYDFFVQVDERLCEKCFTKFRVTKSKRDRDESVTDSHKSSTDAIPKQADSTSEEIEDDTLDLSQTLSQAPLHEVEESTATNSQCDNQSLLTSSSQTSSQFESGGSVFCPTDENEYNENEYNEIETVVMSFARVISSKAYCFICRSRQDLIEVPFGARLQVFLKRRLFIPKRNRCCSKHMIKKRFYENEIPNMTVYSNESVIEAEEIKKFMDKISNEVDARFHDKIGNCLISDERVKALTGYTWDIIFMLEDMMTTMRRSHNRNIVQALVIFLFKLRSENSDGLIATIMDVTEEVVRDSIHSVLKCFREDVLPNHFGAQAHSREFFLQQTAKAANLLYDIDNSLFVICEGTYLRHEKSANNVYQRKSYSGQKKVPLCKPFTICTTNGFVIDLAGPFEGTLNDAKILENILKEPHGISSILKEGDVFILDRGFRDVKDLLEKKGFKVLMPALKGNRDQLTTEESNESRFVTKIRWVIEAVHGIIAQKSKLLHHQFRNQLLTDAATYCKTACFLLNLTGKRLHSDDGKLEIIVQRMKLQKNVVNHLAEKVASANYNRKSVPFQPISSKDLLDFPELTLEDMEFFFTGSYQLSQAISYLGEMLEGDNTLSLSYLKEDAGIVRFEVKSRHINRKTYKCYIHYDATDVGISAIKSYCCNCANGLRTIGCCSHIAALIYHLSYGRYLSRIIHPAAVLTNLFDIDNVCPVINVDSDED